MTTTQTHPFGTNDWSDSELLSRMLRRELAGWREFHARYDRLIYRCIHKVTSRFASSVTAEDVREIFSTLMVNLTSREMHRLRTFDPERGNKLGSWIGLLATNTAWDHLRGVSRQPQHQELEENDGATSEARPADPFEQLLAKERWSTLNAMLRGFSEKDREFVHLFFVEGESVDSVAQKLGISVKTVYSKKHKIRCRLERVVSEVEETTPALAA